jgi:hypothetical protein
MAMSYYVLTLETGTRRIAAGSHEEAAKKYLLDAPPGTRFGDVVVAYSHTTEGRVEKSFNTASILEAYLKTAVLVRNLLTNIRKDKKPTRKPVNGLATDGTRNKKAVGSRKKTAKKVPPKVPLGNKFREPLKVRRIRPSL